LPGEVADVAARRLQCEEGRCLRVLVVVLLLLLMMMNNLVAAAAYLGLTF
jgi:hypothetical protein